MQAQGFDVWKYVLNGYTAPDSHPIDNDGKMISEYNSKAMNSILSGLIGSKFVKVMHCDSTKEI